MWCAGHKDDFWMKTTIRVIDPKNLTPAEFRTASKLTRREHGTMMYDIRDAYHDKSNTNGVYIIQAWLIQVFRKSDNLLLGQCFLDVSIITKKNIRYRPFAQFYVRKEYRRMGLGRRLAKNALYICDQRGLGNPEFDAWSDESERFFRNVIPGLDELMSYSL